MKVLPTYKGGPAPKARSGPELIPGSFIQAAGAGMDMLARSLQITTRQITDALEKRRLENENMEVVKLYHDFQAQSRDLASSQRSLELGDANNSTINLRDQLKKSWEALSKHASSSRVRTLLQQRVYSRVDTILGAAQLHEDKQRKDYNDYLIVDGMDRANRAVTDNPTAENIQFQVKDFLETYKGLKPNDAFGYRKAESQLLANSIIAVSSKDAGMAEKLFKQYKSKLGPYTEKIQEQIELEQKEQTINMVTEKYGTILEDNPTAQTFNEAKAEIRKLGLDTDIEYAAIGRVQGIYTTAITNSNRAATEALQDVNVQLADHIKNGNIAAVDDVARNHPAFKFPQNAPHQIAWLSKAKALKTGVETSYNKQMKKNYIDAYWEIKVDKSITTKGQLKAKYAKKVDPEKYEKLENVLTGKDDKDLNANQKARLNETLNAVEKYSKGIGFLGGIDPKEMDEEQQITNKDTTIFISEAIRNATYEGKEPYEEWVFWRDLHRDKTAKGKTKLFIEQIKEQLQTGKMIGGGIAGEAGFVNKPRKKSAKIQPKLMEIKPDPKTAIGRIIVDDVTGDRERSDGVKWVPEEEWDKIDWSKIR